MLPRKPTGLELLQALQKDWAITCEEVKDTYRQRAKTMRLQSRTLLEAERNNPETPGCSGNIYSC